MTLDAPDQATAVNERHGADGHDEPTIEPADLPRAEAVTIRERDVSQHPA